MGHHAVPEVYNIIRQHKTSIVFVNTRAQAELVFDGLWRINDDNLAIGLHHGSLAVEQRRKVEAAMAAGKLRAVVATSSLDLGIDWGDVDLVIQMGAPKGVSRLMQRIGRANHRLDEPSRAMIAPANRFEVLESLAALEAVEARELDGDPPRPPCLDVLAQHIVGTACAQPIDREAFYDEVRSAQPYRDLPRQDFDDTFDFVATGGYALAAYERWHRLKKLPDGRWMLASPLVARQFRMNVGTIVELPLIKVKMRRGPMLGEVEESFIQGLVPGDTFVFAGRLLRFEGVQGARRAMLARRPAAIPRCRPMAAAACRSRPSWPTACAASCRIRRGIPSCRPRCANGCASSASARPCPAATGCWSRGFRAAASSSSSPTASRAGTRTRRWACC